MSMTETPSSRDEDLETRIKVLVAKMVDGTATDAEKRTLQDLIARRSKSMWSSVFDRLERIRNTGT